MKTLMKEKLSILLVVATSCVLMLTSVFYDSAIYDEPEHLTAAYTYVRYLDYRLNPWHPPLAKDIAGLSLLLFDFSFPVDSPEWQERKRAAISNLFLYGSGNDVDLMLLVSRTSLILFCGLFLYLFARWISRNYSSAHALAAVILLGLSPIFMGNARYVLTDAAAAIGAFLALAAYLAFLKTPERHGIVRTSVLWAIALLMKFSVLLVIPVSVLATALWAATEERERLRCFLSRMRALVSITALALILVTAVYAIHMLNFPLELQQRYNGKVDDWGLRWLGQFVLLTQDIPVLRGLSWYLTGLGRVLGFVTEAPSWPMYLLGEAYIGGRWYYFPLLWLLKGTPPFHLWSILALASLAVVATRFATASTSRRHLVREHFASIVFALFVLTYWSIGLVVSINIGIRHMLPTLPFIAVVSTTLVMSWMHSTRGGLSLNVKRRIVGLLLASHVTCAFFAWPGYVSYFNLISKLSPHYGFWAIEANLDWGQDLRRLARFAERENIQRLHTFYFGGGDPGYYLKERYIPWSGGVENFQPGDMVAISVHHYRMGRAWKRTAIPTLPDDPQQLAWRSAVEPAGRVGGSILLFRVRDTDSSSSEHKKTAVEALSSDGSSY